MKILVGLKWVGLRPEVDPLNGTAVVDSRFAGAGPADWSALEWALRLVTDQGSGTVVVATVGPPEAETVLRAALAAGADEPVLVTGLPTDAASRQVGAELAAVALATGADLMFCGSASLDRGSGAVPAFAAHELGWPQALGLVTVLGPGPERPGLVADRRLDGGRREQLLIEGHGVLSFEAGPELRRAPLASTLASKAALVDVRAAMAPRTPSLAVIGRRAYRPRPRVRPAPQGTTRQRLAGLIGGGPSPGSAAAVELSPSEAAALTVERLVEWGYLDPPASTLGPDDAAC